MNHAGLHIPLRPSEGALDLYPTVIMRFVYYCSGHGEHLLWHDTSSR